ncbi:MAG: cation-translocating P-type ATPase C-terminal domain-containing protein, partial [Vicinamibacteria bacterium]|nr:cation-translocating P-type ATPase C-terminal domain-containing protein [Vicinamibacteria bacterium]
VLSVFLSRLETGTVAEARSFAFSTLVFCELFRAFAARSRALTFWQVGTFTNKHLLAAVAVCAVAQVSLGHLPFVSTLFGVHAMSLADTALCAALGLIPVTVLELRKLLARRDDGPGTSAAVAP